MPVNNSDNLYACSNFIVAPTLAKGANYTTISSALAAASSGDTIFVKPGTYTEDISLKAGVNILAFPGDENLPTVILVGKMSFSAVGTVSVSNIGLQTNGDFVIEVTGSAASIVNIRNCTGDFTDNSGISFTSSDASAALNIFECTFDTTTTGITHFILSSAGTSRLEATLFLNSGASTTASTCSAGSLAIIDCPLLIPFSVSGTTGGTFNYTAFNTTALNATSLTFASSMGINSTGCLFSSGSATALVINGSGNLSTRDLVVNSTNTNALSGSGTIQYNTITYTGASHLNSVTTQDQLFTQPFLAQSRFLAFLGTDDLNVTGDGTNFVLGTGNPLTEVFDVDNNFNPATGVFTAPFDGAYCFTASVLLSQLGAGHTQGSLKLTTSNGVYGLMQGNYAAMRDSSNFLVISGSMIVDMEGGDTATIDLQISHSTKTVDVLTSLRQTCFSGAYVGSL